MTRTTPLDEWIRRKAHIGSGVAGRSFVEALEDYQLRVVNEVVTYARNTTSFYRTRLSSVPDAPVAALSDISRIPFTTPSDLTRDPYGFLAVRQDAIARIVTLRTSGSTGEAKRLFFTPDSTLTVEF